jgi:hypothetical protein
MNRLRACKILLLSLVTWLAVGLTFSQAPRRIWNPTKIPAQTQFVGAQACAECHASKVKTHGQTMMGRALETVAQSAILSQNPKLTFRAGTYTYEILRRGAESFYSVTDGKETITMPILYAFGLGHAGQTYVLKGEAGLYESRLSYYNEIQGLDTTIGQSRELPTSLSDAVGRLMPKDETLQCFSCHTTGTVKGGKLDFDNLVPGIHCEACHGPGADHIALMKGDSNPQSKAIFNPGKLSGDDLNQEFCAVCHRSVDDISSLPQSGGLNNVRFQPYRIFNSKCYSDDRRISCIGCHNVHEPMKTEASAYDAKCTSCHVVKEADTRICKVESKNCTSCHMPKVDLPGSHFKFTDHRIRIVKPGEPYPF